MLGETYVSTIYENVGRGKKISGKVMCHAQNLSLIEVDTNLYPSSLVIKTTDGSFFGGTLK